jgi:hypothetical protein
MGGVDQFHSEVFEVGFEGDFDAVRSALEPP